MSTSYFFLTSDDVAILQPTPFLYIISEQTLVIGDVHCGQEEALLESSTAFVSPGIKEFRQLLDDTLASYPISTVVFNGDLKHNTNAISEQEIYELEYLFSLPALRLLDVYVILGNHDPLLKTAMKNTIQNNSQLQFRVYLKLNGYLIYHGHKQSVEALLTNIHTIILAHEHPAYVFRGVLGESVKVGAFVTLQCIVDEVQFSVIIIPAVAEYASGIAYPLPSRESFLSPLLEFYADIQSQRIYPFDTTTGVLNLYQ